MSRLRFDLTPKEAMRDQIRLRSRVRVTRLAWRRLDRVAGCDVAVSGSGSGSTDRLWAAVMIFRFPEMEPIETATAEGPLRFPYVPGLLSYRELPVLLQAFAQVRELPQVILCDGQGRAHPRRFGLACHLGVALDLPTVGCAKSRLIGDHDPVGPRVGDWSRLHDGSETLGAVLRTRSGVKPLYLSIGHRVTLPDAIRLVLACGGGFRLPEPTRQADQSVARFKRERLARNDRSSAIDPTR